MGAIGSSTNLFYQSFHKQKWTEFKNEILKEQLAPSGDGVLPARCQRTCRPVTYSLDSIIWNLEGNKRDQRRGNMGNGIKKKEEKNRENRKGKFDEIFSKP